MADILDFKKFHNAKKQFRSELDALYDQGIALKFIEQYKDSEGKDIIKVREEGKRILLRTVVQLFKELTMRNPEYTWPQSKEEFDYRLGQFGYSLMSEVGGPIPFLLDMMYSKIITKDGKVDIEQFNKMSPKKDQ